jgi:choline dehydrogenase-like flavoprotein
MSERDIRADVLVIGCGIAGAAAALEAADAGLRTVVITKEVRPEESNTFYAQGGIVSFAPDDKPELLKRDILEAGDSVGDPAAVDILVGEGPRLVRESTSSRSPSPGARPRRSTTPSRPGTRGAASSTSRTPPAGPSRTGSCAPSKNTPASPCSPDGRPSTS